jgi:hypothetical protein
MHAPPALPEIDVLFLPVQAFPADVMWTSVGPKRRDEMFALGVTPLTESEGGITVSFHLKHHLLSCCSLLNIFL